jgi:DNA-binding NtrC family response regulator
VRALGGEISVDSALGRGTRVQISLPVSRVAETKVEPAHVPIPRTIGGAVLIVDDEPLVRTMGAKFLTRHGITVFEASTGKEAIDLLAADRSAIHAVVLDMAMPEVTGDEALPEMMRLRPDIHVIVSSGFSDAEVARHFSGMHVYSLLPKPYTLEQLLAHVRSALEGQ